MLIYGTDAFGGDRGINKLTDTEIAEVERWLRDGEIDCREGVTPDMVRDQIEIVRFSRTNGIAL